MGNFSKMKAKRKDFGALAEQLNKGEQGQSSSGYQDDRVWQYKADEKGNYYGEIRFLPTAEGDDAPFVKTFRHFFKSDSGKWFIADCPTTLGAGNPCPCCEENTRYLEDFGGWKDAPEKAKQVVRNRKRNQQYVSNIMVVKDPANPDNEGKVMLFKYGPRIYQKILGAIAPEFEDETPLDPFDLWEGATFKLKVRKVDGQTSYDKSEFSAPSPLSDDDDKLEEIWKSQHKLAEFTNPEKFESYDKLKTRLEKALGSVGDAPKTAEAMAKKDVADKVADAEPVSKTVDLDDDAGDDDDDTMSFFENLAKS